MDKTIQGMLDHASNHKMDGKVHVMYENVRNVQSLFGDGDGESWRHIKHWRLVIQLGFDCFTLEYFQGTVFTLQGIVVVGPFDLEAEHRETLYHVGDLKGLSTVQLYTWIQDEFHSKESYNVAWNNCQHFVHNFLTEFEDTGHLTRTSHLSRAFFRREVVWEGGKKIKRYAADHILRLQAMATKMVLDTMSSVFKSTFKFIADRVTKYIVDSTATIFKSIVDSPKALK
jgi:hypothetical protein